MPKNKDLKLQKNKLQNKLKQSESLKKPGTFFLIIAAIIFLMSISFKISKIEVSGNGLYSDKEVISASGIQTGDNLFFINRIAAGSRVVVKLPYVDSVAITRTLPNKVTIVVQESNAIGYVVASNEYWTISQSGKFLSKIEADETNGIARISGLTIKKPVVGEIITPAKGEEGKFKYLLDIMYQIQTRGMVADITAIDVSNEANPEIGYQDRFSVKLGEMDNTEYKFGKMLSAISQLGKEDAGSMDLSTGDKVYFNPN